MEESLIQELKDAFNEHADGGSLDLSKLGDVFKTAGEPLPSFKIRELVDKLNKGNNASISYSEFLALVNDVDLAKSWGAKLRKNVQSKAGITQYSGSEQSAEGTIHSLSDAERVSFSNFLSRLLKDDPDVKHLIPIKATSNELFTKVGDGLILCKIVNCAAPGTIDERAINKSKLNTFTINENLNLGINSCISNGCHVVNISAEDFTQGKPHLILGLLWQLIRMRLLSAINLKNNPDLICLLREGETLEMLLALSPEDLLIRWVNYQLDKTSCPVRMNNFSSDLKDSTIYAYLMDEIIKNKIVYNSSTVLSNSDNLKRAELVVANADKVECAGLVSPEDIVKGFQKLNLAFMAELFNAFPNLDKAAEPLVIEETREEKTLRNWMNSLGVRPPVNYLYSDLNDGTVLLFLFNIIKPGSVDMNKINKPPITGASANIKKIENCNKAVETGKRLKLSLVGIAGDDIYNGIKTLTLAIVWQMMHMYTVGILMNLAGTDKPIADAEIIEWANKKLSGTKYKLHNFKDQSLLTSHPIIELIDAIKPGSVNREFVKPGSNDEEKLLNAQYACSMARKIGAPIYSLPEDIVECKSKMVMTMFACLMARDMKGC